MLDEVEEFPRDEYDTTYMNANEEFDRDSQSDDPEMDEGNLSSEEAVELVEEEIREEEAEEIDEFESEDRKSPMPTSEPKPVHVPTSSSQVNGHTFILNNLPSPRKNTFQQTPKNQLSR